MQVRAVHAKTVNDIELVGKTETGMVQGEIQSLCEGVLCKNVSHTHDQQFINGYVEQVKRDQAQSK